MKIKDFQEQIKEFFALGYMPYFNMAVVFAIAILGFIWYNWISPETCVRYDTWDYIQTWWSYFSDEYQESRTPLYPIFIGPFIDLFGLDAGTVVILSIQKLLRLISCFYLWKICKFAGLKDRYIFWLIALWLLLPYRCRYDFDSRIHTESLSMTLYIFMCWSAIQTVVSARRLKWVILCSFWGFLLVFLRPANLIVIPLLGMLYVGLHISKLYGNKLMLMGLLTVLLIGGAAYGYQKYTDNKYGNGMFTNISSYNNYFMLLDAKILYPENFDDEEVRELCKIYKHTDTDSDRHKFHTTLFYRDYPVCIEMRNYVDRTVREHPDEVAMALVRRGPVCLNDPIVFSSELLLFHQRLYRYLPKVWMGIAMLLIYLCASIWGFKRSPQKGAIGVWFSIIGLATYLTSYLGAMSDWGRLNIGVFFIVMLAGFLMLQKTIEWIRHKCILT